MAEAGSDTALAGINVSPEGPPKEGGSVIGRFMDFPLLFPTFGTTAHANRPCHSGEVYQMCG